MVDHAKLFFCSGMLLVFLGAGCASTGSQRNSVASFDSQASTLPSRKRMIIIAKTYEDQGHEQRAVTTYRQVLKRYPKTEQGKFARGRILALNEPDKQKKTPEATQETMLANSVSKPVTPTKTNQPETKKELEEAPFPELPLPEQLVEVSENNSAKLLVNNDSNDSKDSDDRKPAENRLDENAKWPEWSGSKLASAKPKVNSIGAPVDYPIINPALSHHSKEIHKEELLLPPATLLADTSLKAITKKKKADLKDEKPIFIEEVVDLSWKGRQAETVNKEEGWVTSRKETVSILETVSTPEVVIEAESESTFEVDTKKQDLVNHRLASLAYLIGNEEFVAEDTLASLELLLDHEDQHVRINSAEALFRHQQGSKKALQAITSAFSSTDESIRFIAVHALVSAYEQSPEETIQVMVAQLDTDSTSVQRQVALFLGDFRGHSSTLIPRLQQLVDEHPDEEVREAALLSLVCLKE